MFEKECNYGGKGTENEVLRKSEAEGEKEGTHAQEVDLGVRVVTENNEWDKVEGEEGNRTETRVNVRPEELDQGEGGQTHGEDIRESEGNPKEDVVLVRLEEVGGLEREDSGAVFIEVLFLSRVVNPYSWEVLTRGGCFIIES